MMCAEMTKLNEIQVCDDLQDMEEENDLLGSPEMKDLDDLMESIDDQVYSDIFDEIM